MNAKRTLFLTTAPFSQNAILRMLRDMQSCKKASILFISPELELDAQMALTTRSAGITDEALQNERAILQRIKEVRTMGGECSRLWGLF